MGIGSVLRSRYDWITQKPFRAGTSQVEICQNGSKEMAEACQARIETEKIPYRYQGMSLRIALNEDFFFCLKNRRRKWIILGDDFRQKNFAANRTTIKWKLGAAVGLFAFITAKSTV